MRNSAYSFFAILAVSMLMASPIQAQGRHGSEGRGGSSSGRGGAPTSSYSQPRSGSSSRQSFGSGSRGGRSSQPTTVTGKGLGSVSSMNRGSSDSRGSVNRQRSESSYQGGQSRSSSFSQGSGRGGSNYTRGEQGSNRGSEYSRGPQGAGRSVQGADRQQGGRVVTGAGGGQYRAGRPMSSGRPSPGNVVGPREPGHVRMAPGPGRDVERISPHMRDAIAYDRAVRFGRPGHHFFGYRVMMPPPHIEVFNYWGRPYYFCDDIWYRFHDGCYCFCRPPFGVEFLPTVAFHTCLFAFFCDALRTYDTINENANTIVSQNATIAANNAIIAQQNENIALNSGKANRSYALANSLGLVQSYADASVEYFYEDGVFFTKNSSDGKYTVIVPPAGALVQDLPDDYETVTMNGVEYYKVDDTIYRMTIVDGSAYFEVLGQLTGAAADKYELSSSN